eukprot:c22464_g4_i1 orf=346-918(-)
MYLAAIADAQPQPPPVHTPVPPQPVLQSGPHYLSHPQAQQQMAQSALMMSRNPLQYAQQPLSSLHQTQQQHQQLQQHHQQQQQQHQVIHGQHGMNIGGSNSLPLISGESGMGTNSSLTSGGFPDFVRAGNTGDRMQVNRGPAIEMRGSKLDGIADAGHVASSDGNGGSGTCQAANEQDPSYLKASEEDAS